jgi:hypothetical protein
MPCHARRRSSHVARVTLRHAGRVALGRAVSCESRRAALCHAGLGRAVCVVKHDPRHRLHRESRRAMRARVEPCRVSTLCHVARAVLCHASRAVRSAVCASRVAIGRAVLCESSCAIYVGSRCASCVARVMPQVAPQLRNKLCDDVMGRVPRVVSHKLRHTRGRRGVRVSHVAQVAPRECHNARAGVTRQDGAGRTVASLLGTWSLTLRCAQRRKIFPAQTSDKIWSRDPSLSGRGSLGAGHPGAAVSIRACIRVYIKMCVRVCKRVSIRAYIRLCIRVCIRACTRVSTRACMRVTRHWHERARPPPRSSATCGLPVVRRGTTLCVAAVRCGTPTRRSGDGRRNGSVRDLSWKRSPEFGFGPT